MGSGVVSSLLKGLVRWQRIRMSSHDHTCQLLTETKHVEGNATLSIPAVGCWQPSLCERRFRDIPHATRPCQRAEREGKRMFRAARSDDTSYLQACQLQTVQRGNVDEGDVDCT